jgi:hypothetical protein
MKNFNFLFCTILLIAFSSTPLLAEELLKWKLIETLPDGRGYNYSPNSVKTIEGSIMEVYDGIAGPGRIDARQLRIDCEQKKWAIGETRSWVNEVLVPSPNFIEGGWTWMPINETPNEKLISIVCPENNSGVIK